MAIRTWLGMAATAVVAVGCATPPPPHALARGCVPGGNCFVAISVGANCDIRVDPEDVDVPDRGRRKMIMWTIQTDGWMFASGSRGIEFKEPNEEFDFPLNLGRRFIWSDQHSKGGRYPYAIHLVSSGFKVSSCDRDPFISNQ